MSDVIRLGSHAHHYLAIFDEGKAIGFYHSKRLASPCQRIVLYAMDRRVNALYGISTPAPFPTSSVGRLTCLLPQSAPAKTSCR
jgi:hypothetical protein